MAVANRIESLKVKHADLESALDEHRRHPKFDAVTLADMKRKKLAIKEELEQLTRH